MSDFTPVSLIAQGRTQSQSIETQDQNLFPFDAFEFDDPNTTDEPVLSMKSPWSFGVSSIVQGELDQINIYLENTMIEQKVNQDENEWSLSQITIGQNEIDIRVTGLSTAFINLGVDPEGSSVSIGADKIIIDGEITLDNTLSVVDGEVQILGRLAVGTSTENDKFVVESDGAVTCTNITINDGTLSITSQPNDFTLLVDETGMNVSNTIIGDIHTTPNVSTAGLVFSGHSYKQADLSGKSIQATSSQVTLGVMVEAETVAIPLTFEISQLSSAGSTAASATCYITAYLDGTSIVSYTMPLGVKPVRTITSPQIEGTMSTLLELNNPVAGNLSFSASFSVVDSSGDSLSSSLSSCSVISGTAISRII